MTLNTLIRRRFGLTTDIGQGLEANETLVNVLNHSSCRDFLQEAIPEPLVDTLLAAAFSAPSKSDLQQATVILIKDDKKKKRIAGLSPKTAWVASAPLFMVWCGDSRRIRRLAEWRGHPFANDHLDAFMNAAVDAAIVMQTFIIAAESVGLGCCPVSEIRDHIDELSAELELPQWVFPVAGLCAGYPAEQSRISLRLPMSVTVHNNSYADDNLFDDVAKYDQRREAIEQTKPEEQRLVELFGIGDSYGWSENRTRQYALPAREDFGRYIRAQGFNLK